MGCGASKQNPWNPENQSGRKSSNDGRNSPAECELKQTESVESTEAPLSKTTSINTDLNPPKVSIHAEIHEGKPVAELEKIIQDLAHRDGDDSDELIFLEEQDAQNGNRPIHVAAQDGHLEILQWLISKKCKVDCRNHMGDTPLHMAVTYDRSSVVEALLAANADRTIKNAAGIEAIPSTDGDKLGKEEAAEEVKAEEEAQVADEAKAENNA